MLRCPHRNPRLPALLGLAAGLGLCAFAACALFVPGFVLGAEGEATQPPAATEPTEPPATGTETTLGPVPGPEVTPAPQAGSPPATDASTGEGPSGTVPTPPSDPSPGTRLVTLPWGDGPGEVGLAKPGEGLTRGPEALAVAPDGRIVILDSVNRRLVVLDQVGTFVDSWPVALADPRYLALHEDHLYVLDPDVDAALVTLAWNGAEMWRAALPPLGGAVTGLFATQRGACVEVEHEATFLITPAAASRRASAPQSPGSASPAALTALAGRPLGRDLGLTARITFRPGEGVKIRSYRVDTKRLTATEAGVVRPALVAGRAVEHLVSADSDGARGLILGARLLGLGRSPNDRASIAVARFKAGAGGSIESDPAGVLFLEDSPFAYVGLPYSVAPDGRIFQPVPSEAGYTIVTYPRPGAMPAPLSADGRPAETTPDGAVGPEGVRP